MSVLDSVTSHRARGTGNYITQSGKYRLRIGQMKYDPHAYGGELFTVELTVVSAEKTEKPTLVTGPNGLIPSENQEPHKVGTLLSRVDQFPERMKDEEEQTKVGGWLQFLEGLTGLRAGDGTPENPGDFDKAGIMQLYGKDQPFKGRFVDCDVWTKAQKKDPKKTFTQTKWIHVPAEPAPAAS